MRTPWWCGAAARVATVEAEQPPETRRRGRVQLIDARSEIDPAAGWAGTAPEQPRDDTGVTTGPDGDMDIFGEDL